MFVFWLIDWLMSCLVAIFYLKRLLAFHLKLLVLLNLLVIWLLLNVLMILILVLIWDKHKTEEERFIINMIYGVFLKSYLVKNSINCVRLENECVGANYSSVYQLSCLDRLTYLLLSYDSAIKKIQSLFIWVYYYCAAILFVRLYWFYSSSKRKDIRNYYLRPLLGTGNCFIHSLF